MIYFHNAAGEAATRYAHLCYDNNKASAAGDLLENRCACKLGAVPYHTTRGAVLELAPVLVPQCRNGNEAEPVAALPLPTVVLARTRESPPALIRLRHNTARTQIKQAVGTTTAKPGRMEMKALIDDAHLVSVQVVEVGRFSEIFVSTTKHDRSGHSRNQIGFRLRG